jgi:hypothetical protein
METSSSLQKHILVLRWIARIFGTIVFLIGYYFSWKNELIGGIIFIIWWGIMWYLGLFVAERDKGAGVVMGVPMFIIGILFIVYWYRRDVKTAKKQ